MQRLYDGLAIQALEAAQRSLDLILEQVYDGILEIEIKPRKTRFAVLHSFSLQLLILKDTQFQHDSDLQIDDENEPIPSDVPGDISGQVKTTKLTASIGSWQHAKGRTSVLQKTQVTFYRTEQSPQPLQVERDLKNQSKQDLDFDQKRDKLNEELRIKKIQKLIFEEQQQPMKTQKQIQLKPIKNITTDFQGRLLQIRQANLRGQILQETQPTVIEQEQKVYHPLYGYKTQNQSQFLTQELEIQRQSLASPSSEHQRETPEEDRKPKILFFDEIQENKFETNEHYQKAKKLRNSQDSHFLVKEENLKKIASMEIINVSNFKPQMGVVFTERPDEPQSPQSIGPAWNAGPNRANRSKYLEILSQTNSQKSIQSIQKIQQSVQILPPAKLSNQYSVTSTNHLFNLPDFKPKHPIQLPSIRISNRSLVPQLFTSEQNFIRLEQSQADLNTDTVNVRSLNPLSDRNLGLKMQLNVRSRYLETPKSTKSLFDKRISSRQNPLTSKVILSQTNII